MGVTVSLDDCFLISAANGARCRIFRALWQCGSWAELPACDTYCFKLTGTLILNLSVLLKNHLNTVLTEWMKQSDGG